jgi:hypothetical protein
VVFFLLLLFKLGKPRERERELKNGGVDREYNTTTNYNCIIAVV